MVGVGLLAGLVGGVETDGGLIVHWGTLSGLYVYKLSIQYHTGDLYDDRTEMYRAKPPRYIPYDLNYFELGKFREYISGALWVHLLRASDTIA